MSEALARIEEDEGIVTETPPSSGDPMRILEAMLFASAEPLTLNAMRVRLPEDSDLGGMLMDLQRVYESRGVRLVEMNGSWAFRTAAELADALSISREVKRKLSRAAMETLAIIGYHQPVTRAEIENIRGVAIHKGTIDVLMECGWVKPGRRRETPGRPLTWVTTTEFMDHFGLESLNDLPGLDDLKASGLLDRRPAIDALTTGDLFGEETDADMLAEDMESPEAGEDSAAAGDYYEDDLDEGEIKAAGGQDRPAAGGSEDENGYDDDDEDDFEDSDDMDGDDFEEEDDE